MTLDCFLIIGKKRKSSEELVHVLITVELHFNSEDYCFSPEEHLFVKQFLLDSADCFYMWRIIHHFHKCLCLLSSWAYTLSFVEFHSSQNHVILKMCFGQAMSILFFLLWHLQLRKIIVLRCKYLLGKLKCFVNSAGLYWSA